MSLRSMPRFVSKDPETNRVNDKQGGSLTGENISKTMAGAKKKSFGKQQEGPSVSESKKLSKDHKCIDC